MRWKVAVVALALVFAFYVRTVNLNEPYINFFDPLVMWRHAEKVVEAGFLPAEDELRYQPYGWDSAEVLPMTPYSIADLCFGRCDVKFLAKWQPVLYGVMAMAVLAFVGMRVWGEPALPVVFLSLLPGFVLRTAEGFGEKEPIAVFALAVATYFVYRSQQEKPILHGALAGVAMGMALLSWGGYLLFLVAFAAYSALKVLVGEADEKVLAFLPLLLITAVMSQSIPAMSGFFQRTDILAVSGAIAFSLLTFCVSKRVEERWKAAGISLLILIVVGMGLGFNVPSLVQSGLRQLLFPIRGGETGTWHAFSVGEQAATQVVWPWESSEWKGQNQVWQQTGSLLLVGALSAWVAWKSKRDEELLTAVLFFFLFHGATKVVRLIFPFMIGVALAGTSVFSWWKGEKWEGTAKYGVALVALVVFMVNFPLEMVWPLEKGLTTTFGFVLAMVAGLAYLVWFEKKGTGLARFSALVALGMVVFATAQGSLAMAPRVSAMSGGDEDWFENLKWINLNTPPKEVVVTWWDYGYLIQQIAKRASVGDGGNVGPGGDLNWEVGHFFVNANTSESLEWLEEREFSVVTMDSSMIGKFYWVSTLGGNSTAYTLFGKAGEKDVTLQDGSSARATVYVSRSGAEQMMLLHVNNTQLPILSTQRGQALVEDRILPNGIVKNENPGLPVAKGGAYFGGDFALYAPPVAEKSLFTKLYFMYGAGTPFELAFWNPYTKTYLL